jgi:predicted nucleic acid-binding protein
VTVLWLDANVLLRYLTDDPPLMAEQAAALLARAERGEVLLRVSPLVVAEVVWVMLSFYRHPKAQVAEVLISLLRADGLRADDGRQVIGALEAMAALNVDFVDAYLAEVARARGEAVCSFEQDFARLDVDWVSPS